MAIYWYYPSKDALLDAVVDRLIEGSPPSSPSERRLGRALRDVAHAYRADRARAPARVPAARDPTLLDARARYAFLETLFELARRQGIADRDAARFYRVVSSYCSGFALNELATLPGSATPKMTALRTRFARVAAVSA